MSAEDGFTSAVRLELASLLIPGEREARAELAGMLLVARPDADPDGRRLREFAGRRPGDLPLARLCEEGQLRLDVPSSAVARRSIGLVQRALGLRPRLTAVSTTARRHHGPAYRVSLPADVVRTREAGRGARPAGAVLPADPDDPESADSETIALLRGALLVGGSVSAPDRPVHLELSGVSAANAALLMAALGHALPGSRPLHDAARHRIVLKSGSAVADLLAALGATRAFLTFDDRRLRRQLRGEANRLANADAANLSRIAQSAGAQVDAIERAVEDGGWDVFDAELREVALARIANPSASLSELAQLLELPRATLHRRLRRVEDAARGALGGL
jgi:cell division protein WhiA